MAINWDSAEFTKLESGKISKPIPPSHIMIPANISLVNGYLAWNIMPSSASGQPGSQQPTPTLLNEFAQLWRREDNEAILRFASRNGVLWCDETGQFCRFDLKGVEPIATWRRLSREVCAILNVASEIVSGKPKISVDEWRFIDSFEATRLEQLKKPGNSRGEVSMRIRAMLLAWGLGFTLRGSNRKGFTLEIDYRGYMLNAVALQLALTVSKSDSLFVCSGCGLPYARPSDRHRPKRGQANFCEDCGEAKVAQRQADIRRKGKMVEARRLAGKGLSAAEIAALVMSKPETVRRWVGKTRVRP